MITGAMLKRASQDKRQREMDAHQIVLLALAKEEKVSDIQHSNGIITVNGYQYQLTLWEVGRA